MAARKVDSLLEAGANVTVVSPALVAELGRLVGRGEVEYRPRAYQRGDLAGAFVCFAATDDEEVHAAIAAEAEAKGVLLNVVDRPRWCTFFVPSTERRGEVTVAVSTGGASPALARRVREEIGGLLGPQHERAALLLARLRRHLQEHESNAAERQRVLNALVRSELLDLLRAPDVDAVDRLLARHLGAGTSLALLGISFECGAAASRPATTTAAAIDS